MGKYVKPKIPKAERDRLAHEAWLAGLAKLAPNFARQQHPEKNSKKLEYNLSAPPGRETRYHESRVTSGGSTGAKPTQVYTGDKMLGIGVMHKSNLVPIFAESEAKDLASMRRST